MSCGYRDLGLKVLGGRLLELVFRADFVVVGLGGCFVEVVRVWFVVS